ncbi:MAG TPA: beta/gamma crystallin-related protein [Casimicrobiaceae bacterium]|nr:beta/gamma crystallin-related protein [Casimicrobiaceae bacterium]
MKKALTMALGVAGIVVAAQAAAQVTFFEREGFRGRSFNTDRPVGNFERFGFNDRAASVIVDSGNWEVCEDARFSGRCVVLRPGRYSSLGDMGLKYQISSVRPVDYNAGAPGYVDEGYRRRANEDVYTADVTDVRAVMGPPGQRCWVERQQVTENRDNGAQVGGAIAGAVIGGILGHQIGGGRGRDVATAAGAVGGALAGSNIAGRASGGEVASTQDVQHCRDVPNERPAYYDVTYFFRGQEHHVQMTTPPGPTIAVNGNGEPRM